MKLRVTNTNGNFLSAANLDVNDEKQNGLLGLIIYVTYTGNGLLLQALW